MTEGIGQVTTKNNEIDYVCIKPDETFSFPLIEGSGKITTLWITVREEKLGFALPKFLLYSNVDFLKYLRLKIYFDNNDPSVDISVADFFGMGFGKYNSYSSWYLGATSGGYYSYFKMPFTKNCRVEITNEWKNTIRLYGDITYSNKEISKDKCLYFHSKSNTTLSKQGAPIDILDSKGEGRYIGGFFHMRGSSIFNHLKFLEGDIRIFIDDTQSPVIHSTGTEDYFLSGWYFIKGSFFSNFHGCTYINWLSRRVSAYRFHRGNMRYKKGIRIEIDHGENNEIPVEYNITSYWYQKNNT